MSKVIRISSVNPEVVASLAKEFKKKLKIIEKELNNYLSRFDFEISYHYELSVIRISSKDRLQIRKLTGEEPLLTFPLIKTKPQKEEIYELYILRNGIILLKHVAVKKDKVKEDYYVLTKTGMQKIYSE